MATIRDPLLDLVNIAQLETEARQELTAILALANTTGSQDPKTGKLIHMAIHNRMADLAGLISEIHSGRVTLDDTR